MSRKSSAITRLSTRFQSGVALGGRVFLQPWHCMSESEVVDLIQSLGDVRRPTSLIVVAVWNRTISQSTIKTKPKLLRILG